MAYCTFAGHRNIFMADVDKKIEKAIESFLQTDESFTFYIGGMGEFDSKCSSAVRAAKHRHPSKIIRLVLVLPIEPIIVTTGRAMKPIMMML